jgi:phage-related minor tail protein
VKWQADMAKQARKLLNKGDLTAQEVANVLKVQLKILRRHPNAARSPSFSIPKLRAYSASLE